mmetsp:Transcript_9372/g.34384  ORF Transcript_9372/g.34384 Transcript_9372/m.34384 type:complete len:370 (+) Transcript_9372:136-1245(+)
MVRSWRLAAVWKLCALLLLALLLLDGSRTADAKRSKRSTRGTTGGEGVDTSEQAEESTKELLNARSVGDQGVIELMTEKFMRYATARGRQYSLIVFCNAKHLQSEQLQLSKLRAEFMAASNSYLDKYGPNSPDFDKLFFVEVEYKESPEIFHALQINSLPMILRISPSLTTNADSLTFDIKDADKMDGRKYGWDAEGIASFVKSRTSLRVDAIKRPSVTDEPWFPFVALISLASAVYAAYKAFQMKIQSNPYFLGFACLAICFFSLSGGMYNIIRGVPMFSQDPRTGKLLLFSQQPQGQLGFEGFTMGSMYLGVGTTLAGLAFGTPIISNASLRRIVSTILSVCFAFFAWKVIDMYKWKTGYRVHPIGF